MTARVESRDASGAEAMVAVRMRHQPSDLSPLQDDLPTQSVTVEEVTG